MISFSQCSLEDSEAASGNTMEIVKYYIHGKNVFIAAVQFSLIFKEPGK